MTCGADRLVRRGVVLCVSEADHVAVVVQPSGTVTLVFTDVEGSTRLLRELGRARYQAALAEHRRIFRVACGRRAGYEVDTAGDGFFYAFPSARDAVAAVEEAMAAFEATPIRVRAGIHTVSRLSTHRSTSAWRFTRLRGSWVLAMAGRCCFRRRRVS